MGSPTAPQAGGIALVLPAHNEAATVAAVIDRTPDTVAGIAVSCVVVDDGSTDATAELARLAGATVIGHGARRGLGAAVRTGLRHAVRCGVRVVAFCDADGEYAPEELGNLVLPILRGDADYVVGSRFAGTIRRMHPHRRAGNHVLTWALRRLADTAITDGQSGYRALSADAARTAEIVHDYNYAQVLTLNLLRQGLRYAEVPISYAFREHGRSFVQLHHYLRAVVPAIWRELAASRADAPVDSVGAVAAAIAPAARPSRQRSSAAGGSVPSLWR
ncbi:MAG TPA: glycosyltransferase family 2 protein [Euzebyales bacterium]